MSEEKKKAEQIAILFCAETDVIKPNFLSIKQAKKHVKGIMEILNECYNSVPTVALTEKYKEMSGVLTELNKM